MHRVTEGIVDRSHFLVDLWIMPPNVGHGQRNEFSKGSRSIHAHAQRMRTQVPPSCQAIAAAATDHMPLATHDIAWIEVVDVRAHFDDLADKFVPDGHRHRNRLLRPGVPLVDMNVGAADAGISNANQNVVDTDGRLSNLFQPEASFRTPLYQGFHSILQFATTNRSQIIVFAHTVYRKYRSISEVGIFSVFLQSAVRSQQHKPSAVITGRWHLIARCCRHASRRGPE